MICYWFVMRTNLTNVIHLFSFNTEGGREIENISTSSLITGLENLYYRIKVLIKTFLKNYYFSLDIDHQLQNDGSFKLL